ncbi:LANO_0D04148g1_1 [Lachancea nothofagi CBS 11611]|uniref:LANO_0D04148g1_1 n=1 Tax=Lachancea nothofagi CBS 11611 TaxID=1266666 RepID=A0A1G4JGA1_9SACH|nr:LANO_0D04148g1_1 [Lachancea nothofagi CBS 11611]
MLKTASWSKRAYSSVPVTYFHPTIYALSTSPGQKSAIAVVRVTGTHSKYILQQLTGSQNEPVARRASLRNLYSAVREKKILLDSSLTLYFANPRSFTGEDMLELHLHGGRAVVKSVLKAIEELGDRKNGLDIRYAQPGEFSQRAFQNGRMDLTQIEGVGELIDAETETQRRSATSGLTGQNKQVFDRWRSTIVSNIAQLTALIDFGDDAEIEDIDHIVEAARQEMHGLREEMHRFVRKVDRSSILQNGIKVALLGSPNAGKSSLLNCITNEDTSNVSNIPGTTRDAIDVPIDVKGYKVVLCDTAGIRHESEDRIELEGIKRAKAKAFQCDLAVLVVDPTKKPYIGPGLRELVNTGIPHKNTIIAINKMDLVDPQTIKEVVLDLQTSFEKQFAITSVSCRDLRGIEELVNHLSAFFEEFTGTTTQDSDPIAVSRRVQEIMVKDVLFGVDEFLASSEDIVMASENLNYAADGIGKITGQSVGIEEVLGVVFSRFCVGK